MSLLLSDAQKELLLKYIELGGTWDDASQVLNTAEYTYNSDQCEKLWTEMKEYVIAKNTIKEEDSESNQELNDFEQRAMKLIENDQSNENDQNKSIKDEQSESIEDGTEDDDQDGRRDADTISNSLEQNDDENYEFIVVVDTDSENESTPITDNVPTSTNMEENNLSQCGATNSIDNSISTQEPPDGCIKNKEWLDPLKLYKTLIASKMRKKRISTLIKKQTAELQRKSTVCSNYYAKKTKLLESHLLCLRRRTQAREQLYSKKMLSMDRKIRLLETKMAKKIESNVQQKKD